MIFYIQIIPNPKSARETYPWDGDWAVNTPGIDNSGLMNSPLTSWLYPFEWENNFSFSYPAQARTYWYVPYILSAIYVLYVKWLGPDMMKDRQPIECKLALRYNVDFFLKIV